MVDDAVPSEQCVARCRNAYDVMRVIPARCARVFQRGTGPISRHFFIIFQAIRVMSKPCNPLVGGETLLPLDTPWGRASGGFTWTMRSLRSLPWSQGCGLGRVQERLPRKDQLRVQAVRTTGAVQGEGERT
jgi:hypothetical protein